MGDFEINDSILEVNETEIIDDMIVEATQRLAQERERLLAMCLQRGYDGVDIKTQSDVVTNYDDYRFGFEYEAWEGEPEPIGPFESNVKRYDFRTLEKHEKRQLLAQIGNVDMEGVE